MWPEPGDGREFGGDELQRLVSLNLAVCSNLLPVAMVQYHRNLGRREFTWLIGLIAAIDRRKNGQWASHAIPT